MFDLTLFKIWKTNNIKSTTNMEKEKVTGSIFLYFATFRKFIRAETMLVFIHTKLLSKEKIVFNLKTLSTN